MKKCGLNKFNPGFYLGYYPDLRRAFGNSFKKARRHYDRNGRKEGRMPNPFFDPKFYLKRYPDIRKSVGKKNYEGALKHWLGNGIKEGRQGSAVFHIKGYLQAYPKLSKRFGRNYSAAFNHWKDKGNAEGRVTTADGVCLQIRALPIDIQEFSRSGSKSEIRFFSNRKGSLVNPGLDFTNAYSALAKFKSKPKNRKKSKRNPKGDREKTISINIDIQFKFDVADVIRALREKPRESPDRERDPRPVDPPGGDGGGGGGGGGGRGPMIPRPDLKNVARQIGGFRGQSMIAASEYDYPTDYLVIQLDGQGHVTEIKVPVQHR